VSGNNYKHLAVYIVKTLAETTTVFRVVALCYTGFVIPVASQEAGSSGISSYYKNENGITV
jgi:hypothetical protein